MKNMKKLHSIRGASLLIALVFMLFCSFVGGSVLAAATANAGRVEELKSDQQEYLNERSAALLLKDELPDTKTSMVINKSTVTKVQIESISGGIIHEIGTPTTTVTTTITLQTKSGTVNTAVERIMYESAIMRYLLENKLYDYNKIIIEGFVYCDGTEIKNVKQFWIYDNKQLNPSMQSSEATMSVELTRSGDVLTSVSAGLYCNSSYSFYVDFGEDAKLNLHMLASVGQNTVGPIEEFDTESGRYYMVTAEYDKTTVSWDAPEITKGGAVA